MIPVSPKKPFAGRAYVVRAVWFRQKCLPAGAVITCTAEEFELLADSTRVVRFDPNNPAHADALKKSVSAHGAG